MTDLIKNEAEFIRNCATDIETGEPLDDDQMCNMYVIDAHRIADLIDAVEERIEELTERLTAATDDAKEAEAYAQELEERNKELTLQLLATSGQAADALDKLTKAEFLKTMADYNKYVIAPFLAKLEGKE